MRSKESYQSVTELQVLQRKFFHDLGTVSRSRLNAYGLSCKYGLMYQWPTFNECFRQIEGIIKKSYEEEKKHILVDREIGKSKKLTEKSPLKEISNETVRVV